MDAPRKRHLLRFIPLALALYVAIGVGLRVTWKDSVPLFSVVYYATPLPLLAIATFFAGIS